MLAVSGYPQCRLAPKEKADLTNTTIRLLFSGAVGLLGILATLILALTGMILDWNPVDILALSGPFASVTFAAVTFFLGHANGHAEAMANGAK